MGWVINMHEQKGIFCNCSYPRKKVGWKIWATEGYDFCNKMA